jgi:hypothetical protein
MLTLAGNGEGIKILLFGFEKKRGSGDLGFRRIFMPQIIVSHTFVGDAERDSSGQNLV